MVAEPRTRMALKGAKMVDIAGENSMRAVHGVYAFGRSGLSEERCEQHHAEKPASIPGGPSIVITAHLPVADRSRHTGRSLRLWCEIGGQHHGLGNDESTHPWQVLLGPVGIGMIFALASSMCA